VTPKLELTQVLDVGAGVLERGLFAAVVLRDLEDIDVELNFCLFVSTQNIFLGRV
jgi:hypothetical protein